MLEKHLIGQVQHFLLLEVLGFGVQALLREGAERDSDRNCQRRENKNSI